METCSQLISAQSPGLCTLTLTLALVGRHNGMYMYINQIMPTHSIPLNTYYRFCCAYKSYIVLL